MGFIPNKIDRDREEDNKDGEIFFDEFHFNFFKNY